jgi:acyl-CoA synthetase (AMP-forming)/AMP-acid ligase II
MRVSGSYLQWQFSWLSTRQRKIMIYPTSAFWLVALHQSPPSFKNKVMKVLPNAEIGQAYGMTETCTVISLFPPSQRIGTPGSAEVFIPGIRARMVKPDGSLAKSGEHGELYITGPSMALRYYNEKACVEFRYVRAHSDDSGLSTEPRRPSSTGESSLVGSWRFRYHCDGADGSILATRRCSMTRMNFSCLIASKLINPSPSSAAVIPC